MIATLYRLCYRWWFRRYWRRINAQYGHAERVEIGRMSRQLRGAR